MLALTVTMAALAAAAPNPCHDPALGLRCPDLVMAPPSHLRLARSPSRKRVVLRMENRIVNLGAGPAELFGERVSRSEMRARQVVTDAAGRRYRIVTGAELYFKSVPSRGGSYWKSKTCGSNAQDIGGMMPTATLANPRRRWVTIALRSIA